MEELVEIIANTDPSFRSALDDLAQTLKIPFYLAASFYGSCCPTDLPCNQRFAQITQRIEMGRSLVGEEFHEMLMKRIWCLCPFNGSPDGPLKDLFLLFGGARDSEGDFGLTLFSKPTTDPDLLDMAHVNFMALNDCLAITGLKGPPSEHAEPVVRRFGRKLLQQDFYHMTQESLGGTKPFNFLIGLVLEIAYAQGLTKVRGFDRHRLPFLGATMLAKHGFAGAYYGSGFRQTDNGIFEASFNSRDELDGHFARITGRKDEIRAQRKPVFEGAKSALKKKCPYLFQSSNGVDFGVQAIRERLQVETS